MDIEQLLLKLLKLFLRLLEIIQMNNILVIIVLFIDTTTTIAIKSI